MAWSRSAGCQARALWISKQAITSGGRRAACATATSTAAHIDTPAALASKQAVVIPRRKPRHALSVLEALATTASRDPNAPDYRFMDDPYMIPVNGFEKRMFALSKTSGQKAAQFVVNSWPHLFTNDPSEPKIKAYKPSSLPYVHPDVSEQGLLERIEREKTLDAINAYEKLKSQDIVVSLGTKKLLFELACVYNGQDPPAPVTRDENWFRENFFKDYVKHAKTWKDDSFAEKMFNEFEEKDADIYTSMILGLAKYYDVEKAWAVYEEALAKGIHLRTEVYNAIMDIVYYLKDTYESRFELAISVLKTMDEKGTVPNLYTFNAIFHLLSRINRFKAARPFAMEVLNEMKACKIVPSLGTWHYMLQVFYPRSSREQADKPVLVQDGKILHQVLDELADQQFEYRHDADLRFFAGAMLIAASLRDLDAAYKIDKLYNYGRNTALIGDAVLANNYYTFFFKLVTEVEPLEKVMSLYRRLVPNIWVPGYAGMELLMSTIELYEGYGYLPEIWASVVSLDLASRSSIPAHLMKLMAAKSNDSVLQQQLVLLTDRIRSHVLEGEEAKRAARLTLNGEMYGYLILTCLHGNEFDRAWAMMPYLKKAIGTHDRPSEKCLLALLQACIARGDTSKALECAALAKSLGLSMEAITGYLQQYAAETGNTTIMQELRERL